MLGTQEIQLKIARNMKAKGIDNESIAECTDLPLSIMMGLNKPIHFTDVESSTRDILNLTTVAVVDAIVQEQIEKGE